MANFWINMPKIIFQNSFHLAGIMCFDYCGSLIQNTLEQTLEEYKQQKLLPTDAKLFIAAEPNGLGIHCLTLLIESSQESFQVSQEVCHALSTQFKKALKASESDYEIVEADLEKKQSTKQNWINILVNLATIITIIALYFIFPPSILLTIGLTILSYITTAFTAREYLMNFFSNLVNKNLNNMATTISFGWFLSLAHSLFHVISMPLVLHFSMIFMGFIMPILLITCVNLMDGIKELVTKKSQKMSLKGTESLFPQMCKEYLCYQLRQEAQINVTELLNSKVPNKEKLQNFLNNNEYRKEKRNLLREGMIIQVNSGECFPVDGLLLERNSFIDASLLTGEPRQIKNFGDSIHAGAINLGPSVKIYAIRNGYGSTVTRLLFPANRARKQRPEEKSTFFYLYTGLVILGVLASIAIPISLGAFTIPLFLQNLIGILFSVCPCTIAIAHKLPPLISIFHRGNRGIYLRDESLASRTDQIHTLVFDKTGTLTTGESTVESSDISFPSGLWQRIYLLEKQYGGEHPVARAIVNYYEAKKNFPILLKDIQIDTLDSHNRGLSAKVQKKEIHLGNAEFLEEIGIKIPPINQYKINQGYSPVYVAQDRVYRGVIYIRHEPRPGVVTGLAALKHKRKKLIMLTGDNEKSAKMFNLQISTMANTTIFEEEDIYAQQKPEDKVEFLRKLMLNNPRGPKGVCFVGDGLNDAPCSRKISEMEGTSFAISMEQQVKTSFFSDICLDGSLNYLFKHTKINRFLKKNVSQNQGILAYSTLCFLIFIISFSIVGIPVVPLIPLGIMLATTLFVIFNSYRTQLSIDTLCDRNTSWVKKALASDFSLGLLMLASSLLTLSLLIPTLSTGSLTLPLLVFSLGAGIMPILASSCTLASIILFSLFALLVSTYMLTKACALSPIVEEELSPSQFDPSKEAIQKQRETPFQETESYCVSSNLNYFFNPSEKETRSENNKERPSLQLC